MSRSHGKTALVTGAAGGIGRVLVRDLLATGRRVLATDRDEALLAEAVRQEGWDAERLLTRVLDVTDPAAWHDAADAVVQAWGRLDEVFNIAGYLRPAWCHEATDEDVHRHLDINVKGVVLGTRTAARRMLEQEPKGGVRGHIVNMASLASMAPVPGLGLYVASKYAVRGFSMAAAQELGPRGVAVSTVCPDAVQTPMLDLQKDYTEASVTFTAPKFLRPEQVSGLIVGKVLRTRPVLVSIPKSRAFLARLSDLFPSVAGLLARTLHRQGDAVRRRLQDS